MLAENVAQHTPLSAMLLLLLNEKLFILNYNAIDVLVIGIVAVLHLLL